VGKNTRAGKIRYVSGYGGTESGREKTFARNRKQTFYTKSRRGRAVGLKNSVRRRGEIHLHLSQRKKSRGGNAGVYREGKKRGCKEYQKLSSKKGRKLEYKGQGLGKRDEHIKSENFYLRQKKTFPTCDSGLSEQSSNRGKKKSGRGGWARGEKE